MITSERRRPLCKEAVCEVEISAAEKYCAGHQYMIQRWLEKSRATLKRAVAKAEGK